MNWLLNVGDTDIMRDATSAAAVFSYRARRGWRWVTLAAMLAILPIATLVLLVLGPDGTGLAWLTRDKVAVAFSITLLVAGGLIGWLVIKFMPTRNDRIVLALRKFVRERVDPAEAALQALSEDELRAKTPALRARLAEGASLDEIRAEAYACVREASRRAKAHRQFECQLIGGRIIEDCNVAEMRTGEGKTIVCYVANYMKVLQGLKVHMVTVNDYLVKRDAEFCRSIFELLGISVGFISSDMEAYGPGAMVRKESYNCDITYGTNSEFGFDYLRDNMKESVQTQVQGRQDFVVVDEVDSILIDEARTPLIISGPAHDDLTKYRTADNIARSLIRKQENANRETARRIPELESDPPSNAKGDPKFKDGLKKFKTDPMWLSSDEAEAIGHLQYFVVELDRKSAHMTENGAKAAQAELGIGTFYDSKNMNWPHYIDNALKAHLTYQKDKEYVIQEGAIIIVDEFTGRLMTGRQWSDGLHQAVEAKEGVTIKQESQTLATITLQNLFKLYKQLAGMTGTAMTEAEEFMKIYKLEVVAIPTNRPVRRLDYNDKIYKTESNKFDMIVEEIRSMSHSGYPDDPWSLRDMLQHAQHTLVELRRAGNNDADIPRQIEIINKGLADFAAAEKVAEKAKQTEQEAAFERARDVLIDAYQRLMGDNVGGRPILVGTVSVEKSEKLSQLLTRTYGIDHEVLNAKNHAREAEIVVKAGHQHESQRGKHRGICGNVTIATNMAGRGTDIRLGPGVADIGGLHVLGTERHESRRIDNQLRGRCGRQGDPGSSRFFLSLDDDLLRLFMGEWVLRMLNMLGFQEGMAIEDKRLNNGIARAQKKVEERNFNIRKSLLDYDEVMDYQRKTFYSMRQRVVEGRGMSELIWEMIDQGVGDAIERYYDPAYPATCAAEWASHEFGVPLDGAKLDAAGYDVLSQSVRELAIQESRSNVQRTFGEYIDPDVDPEEWDVRGLTNWVATFGLTLTQNQVKKGDPDQLQEQILEAAQKKIEATDLKPLEQFTDPLFPKVRLARWAKDKFDVEIPLDELQAAPRDEAEQLIGKRMREAYRKREVEYPVGAVIDWALQRSGNNVNEFYAIIARWANRKYSFDWTFEHFAGKDPHQIFNELRTINEDYLKNGKLEKEVERSIQSHPDGKIVDWARQRFGAVMEVNSLDLGGNVREQLLQFGYEMLRFELTQLERKVLLGVFEQIWKDHMYSMDLLRHSIGLRGYAEQDPKIAYKREGTRLFNEMLENIRERVTDLIFKVHVTMGPDAGESGVPAGPSGPDAGSPALANVTLSKSDATNAGFSAAASAAGPATPPGGQRPGESGAAQPIRREVARVGRNDPCPCGSGKKYKQCHGRGA